MKARLKVYVGMILTVAVTLALALPAGIVAKDQETGHDYYFVAFAQCPNLSMRQSVIDIGAELLDYHGDNVFAARIDALLVGQVAALSAVSEIRSYTSEDRLDHNLNEAKGTLDLEVYVFDGADMTSVTTQMIALGTDIRGIHVDSTNLILCSLEASRLGGLARIRDVEWITGEAQRRTAMNLIQSDPYMGHDTPQAAGYTGNGANVLGEIQDNGCQLNHPDLQIQWTDGTVGVESHGTSTTGIVFSTGQNSANAQGCVYQGTGAFADWYTGRGTSIANLWNGNFNEGNAGQNGVFQSNSWSQGTCNGQYTGYSNQDDTAANSYPYVLQLWAMANGNDGTSEGMFSQDASAKNIIAVGAVDHQNTASLSDDEWVNGGAGNTPSRGPAPDGRQKPELCGPFDWIYTTTSGSGYTSTFGGTSGATPCVAGAAGLVYDMYQQDFFDNNPSGDWPRSTTVKAVLIADAYQYPLGVNSITRNVEGWGTPDMEKIYDLGAQYHIIEDYPQALDEGESWSRQAYCDGSYPLKVSLVWNDPAAPGTTGSSQALINNLDLKVTSPGGTVYWGNNGLWNSLWSSSGTGVNHWSQSSGYRDDLNNVENVFVQSPATGQWTVEVVGRTGDLPSGPQHFSLVASGAQDDGYPPVFSGLESVTNPGTGNSLDLHWTSAADNEGSYPVTYNIYRATTSGGQNFGTPTKTHTPATTPGNPIAFEDTGLSAGTTYWYVVRAQDAYGNEDTNLVEHSGTPQTVPEVTVIAPNIPDIIAGNPMNVLWTATDAEDGANLDITIQYSPDGGASWTTLETSSPGPPYNNDGTYTWDTSTVGDGVGYRVRVEALDSDMNTGSDINDHHFSVDNVVDDEWFLQVETSGSNRDLDMKPVEHSPNTIQSNDITSAGQYLVGAWETTKTFTGASIDGPWTFNVYGHSSNSDLSGNLYAKVFSSSDTGTPIDVTVNDNEDVGSYTLRHLFTWSDTLAGGIPDGDGLLVEIWLDVSVGSGGALSSTYTYAGVTASGGPHDAYFYDCNDMTATGPDMSAGSPANDIYEFTDVQYIYASASNDVRASSIDPGFFDEIFTRCDMIITENPATMTGIDLTFEGHGDEATDLEIWVLNQATTSWEMLGTAASAPAGTDITVTRTISAGFSDYVQGNVISWGCYQTDDSDIVHVDYLEACVSYYSSPPIFSLEYDYIDTQSSVCPTIDYGGTPVYDIDLTGVVLGTWVFVSFPIDATGDVLTLFDDAGWGDGGTSWDVAQWYDNANKEWRSYSIYRPAALNDMDILDNSCGVWLHLTTNGGDQQLTVGSGLLPTGTVSINLYNGWNLVGYPTQTSRRASDTLPAQADMLAHYDLAQPYRITDRTNFNYWLYDGNAYWIRVTSDCVWQVDA